MWRARAGRTFRGRRPTIRRPPAIRAALLEGPREFGSRTHHAHAATPAPLRGLDDHREAHFLSRLLAGGCAFQRLATAGEDRHTNSLGDVAGGDLVAKLFQQLGPGTNKDDVVGDTSVGQLRIFRQESVARMNRVDFSFFGERDDRVDVEIRANRLAGLPDGVGFVRFEPMQGKAVFVRVDPDGANAQLVPGPEHPDRDFTAIGNQQTSDSPHWAFSSGRRPSATNWGFGWASDRRVVRKPPARSDPVASNRAPMRRSIDAIGRDSRRANGRGGRLRESVSRTSQNGQLRELVLEMPHPVGSDFGSGDGEEFQ